MLREIILDLEEEKRWRIKYEKGCFSTWFTVMDICHSCEDISNEHGECICDFVDGASIDDLGDIFGEAFKIHEAGNITPDADADHACNIGCLCTDVLDVHQSECMCVGDQKCLCKHKTFQRTTLPIKSGSSNEEVYYSSKHSTECLDTVCSSSKSSHVVSAMKGSREKEGMVEKKKAVGVRWDPEVRDPPPTAVSHVVKIRSTQRPNRNNNKKNGKNKQQKGKKDKHAAAFDGKGPFCRTPLLQKSSPNLPFISS